MGDRIMSRPLDPGADANWDNTFGTTGKPPLVQKPTYDELASAVKEAAELLEPSAAIHELLEDSPGYEATRERFRGLGKEVESLRLRLP